MTFAEVLSAEFAALRKDISALREEQKALAVRLDAVEQAIRKRKKEEGIQVRRKGKGGERWGSSD